MSKSSRIVDERVVEMRFDNAAFEKNVKTTMNTLSKLKEALNFTKSTEALTDLNKATKDVRLEGIAAGVQALEKRFSTLGIVGMTVIQNVTNALTNKLARAVNFVSDSIVSGGIRRAMNIENAHFQLQALLKDEVKVQAVMADAMESVDGTAYAYDEAAKAASQFAASGIQAGDEMLNALKGITGVAAMTNSDFESIANIFTTVAGNGRLMGDQLLQLSSRGLNAASTMVDYFKEVRGQSSITETEVRDMVSKGKISFKDFSDAMTWSFGDSAKRANETFTGAMSNMKSALARIGAGFISPLVEQNGELVQLFNALRIQINNVKSALVFDEQKSAISGLSKEVSLMVETTSQFVKDGSVGFDTFTTAILKTSKSEEELEAINEKLSESYDKVKESGFASVDTLIDFNQNGINATKAIKDYLNGVMDGTVKASSEVKKSINELTGGVKVLGGDVTNLAREGKLSYDIFTSAVINSSGAIATENGLISDVVSNLMAKIKESGSVTMDSLIELNQNGINATKALKSYMNGVTEGSIKASYTTKKAIEEITNGTRVLGGDITKLAEEGKISYDILQSALEESYGDQKALTKQVTDFVRDRIAGMVKAINEADLTKPMEAFYYVVEAVKNVTKGLYSVIKPVGSAFRNIFLNFSADSIIEALSRLEDLTAKFKLSERSSKNLQDAFEGVFSIVKLLVDGFASLFGVTVSIGKPVDSLVGWFLELAGVMGRSLKNLSEWIGGSTKLKKAFSVVSSFVQTVSSSVADFIYHIDDAAESIWNLQIVQEIVEKIVKVFGDLGLKAAPYIDIFTDKMKSLKGVLKGVVPDSFLKGFNGIPELFESLKKSVKGLNLDKVSRMIENFKMKLKEFSETIKSNESFMTFVDNFKKYMKRLKEGFTFEHLFENIDRFMSKMGAFGKWLSEKLGPLFKDFSFGGVLASGGGIALIYSLVKMSKAFETLSKSVKSIPDLLGKIGGTLAAYQKNLKAEAIKNIAIAIAVLAGSLTLLSFADMDNLQTAAKVLGIVGTTLFTSLSMLFAALNKGKTIEGVLGTFSKGISKSMKNLTNAVKWKAIGSAIKSIGATIITIALSIIALGIMYNKYPNEIEQATVLIATISKCLFGAVIVMSALGTVMSNGMKSFGVVGAGVLALSIALALIIGSLKKLMNIEFPDDWEQRFDILQRLLGGIAMLGVLVGLATNISGFGGSKGKLGGGPILALAAMLYVTVIALNKIFQMDLPDDYEDRIDILSRIFGSFAMLLLVIGASSKLAGGSIKAAGSILSICVFIGVIIGALMILAIFPYDKLEQGAIALGGILVALGVALAGAGQIAKKDAYKSVLAMAITVGAITAALGFISLVPMEPLAKATTAIGIILLALATDFLAIGTIAKKATWKSVTAMIGGIAVIAAGLYFLADKPWESLAAAGGAMTATLLALSLAFFTIGKVTPDNASIIGFVACTVALIPIVAALTILASQPWEALMSGVISLAAMVATISVVLIAISGYPINVTTIGAFVAVAVSLIPIAFVIKMLSNLSWEQVAVGLTTLAGALVIIGVAAVAGNAVAPALIALSGALVIFSLAISAVGVGLVVFMASLMTTLNLLNNLLGSLGHLADFKQAGTDLIDGFIAGIVAGFNNLIATVKEVAGNVLGAIKDVLGIHSPSTEAHQLGEYTDEGFANGVMNGENKVTSAIDSVFGKVTERFDVSKVFGTGKDASSNLASGLLSGEGDVSSAISNVMDKTFEGVDLSGFNTTGEHAANELMNGFSGENGNDISSYMSSMFGEANTNVDLSSFGTTGVASMSEFMNGFTGGENGNDISSYMSSMFGEANESVDISSFSTTGEESATTFFESFSTKGIEQANSAALNVITALNTAINEQTPLFEESGLTVISSIGESMEKSTSSVTKAVQGILIVITKEFTDKNSTFSKKGTENISNYISGIRKKFTDATNAGTSTAMRVIAAISKKIPEFLSKGTESANAYLQGFKNKYADAAAVGKTLSEKILSSLSASNENFKAIGANVGQGLIDGLNSKVSEAAKAGANIAKAAYEASKKELDVNSPSRKMFKLGDFAGVGFIKGLLLNLSNASVSGKRLGDETLKGLSEAIKSSNDLINSEFSFDPVIHPVVDLSSVSRSANEINRLFNETIALTSKSAAATSDLMSSSRRSVKDDSKIQNPRSLETYGTNINLEQNFYSPKALDAIEIYRQTNNQISRLNNK